MPIVIDPDQIHSCEVDDCVFKVKALTGRQVLSLSSTLGSVDTNGDAIYEVLNHSIHSWTGVQDAHGVDLPVNETNVDMLPVEVAVKVFQFVAGLSGLNGDDRGN